MIQLDCKLDNGMSKLDSPYACFGEDQEVYRKGNNFLEQDETKQVFKNKRESLSHVFKEKDRKLKDLQQHVVSLEAKLAAKAEDMEACLQDKENLAKIAKEKDICIEILQKDIAILKKESVRRELEATNLARLDAEKGFMEEKEMLLKVTNEKNQIMESLQLLAPSLEQDLTNAVI